MTGLDDQRSSQAGSAPAWIAWLVVAAVLLGTFVLGAWLFVTPGGSSDSTNATDETSETPASDETTPGDGKEATEPPPAEATDPPSTEGEPVSLTALASVTAPASAPPNNDVDGSRVTFVAENMLDGVPTTAWRLAGDQTGTVIDFHFANPVTITAVGLVNGYAKVSEDSSGQSFDWYQSNRRVLRAQWVIAGQTFDQTLIDATDLQAIDVGPVQTDAVQLVLTEVGPPGTVNPRDYTAISEAAFSGFES